MHSTHAHNHTHTGDLSPETILGRAVAVFIMIAGIVGVFSICLFVYFFSVHHYCLHYRGSLCSLIECVLL